jgi:hypothetical protein
LVDTGADIDSVTASAKHLMNNTHAFFNEIVVTTTYIGCGGGAIYRYNRTDVFVVNRHNVLYRYQALRGGDIYMGFHALTIPWFHNINIGNGSKDDLTSVSWL